MTLSALTVHQSTTGQTLPGPTWKRTGKVQCCRERKQMEKKERRKASLQYPISHRKKTVSATIVPVCAIEKRAISCTHALS